MTNALGVSSAACTVAAVGGLAGRWAALLAAGLILFGMAYVSSTHDEQVAGGESAERAAATRAAAAVAEADRRHGIDKRSALAALEAELTQRHEQALRLRETAAR